MFLETYKTFEIAKYGGIPEGTAWINLGGTFREALGETPGGLPEKHLKKKNRESSVKNLEANPGKLFGGVS